MGATVTNGGRDVMSGEERGGRLYAWLAFAAVGAVYAAVNAASVIDDRSRLGRPVPAWEPWTWELTSLASWLAVAPLVFMASARVRPPRFSWPAAIAIHALCSVAASLAHTGLMTGLRMLIYAAVGEAYGGAARLGDVLIYEYRKDAITYAALVLVFVFFQRLSQSSAIPEERRDDFRLEVRDGSRTVWLAPSDVEWAQAAGNYVELHGPFGTLLYRKTLSALEEELAPFEFKRIHRARIVRLGAVSSIETKSSGDFELVLAGGIRLAGSRRYRDRLA